MSGENLKRYSQVDLFNRGEGVPTVEQVKLGCLQRIADATEAMANEYNRLIREAKRARETEEYLRKDNNRMARSNAALRGVVNRLKRQLAEAKR